MAFEVSVIIPVYNAARYVEQAVRSALDQPETGEVLLIEDGCPDPASLPTCRRIAESDRRVRLLRHPGGKNRGAGPSRNLGIAHATHEYVAFLDADDFYLPNRFASARAILEADPAVDGVYEALGVHFASEEARRKWLELGHGLLTTMRGDIPPERIFEEQAPLGRGGYCSIVAITLRRKVLAHCGGFPDLAIGEDTVFLMKLAACANLRFGQMHEPVAIRRVHAHNRVTTPRNAERVWQARRDVLLAFLAWLRCAQPPMGQARVALVLNKMLWDMQQIVPAACGGWRRRALLARRVAAIIWRTPSLLVYKDFLRRAVRRVVT